MVIWHVMFRGSEVLFNILKSRTLGIFLIKFAIFLKIFVFCSLFSVSVARKPPVGVASTLLHKCYGQWNAIQRSNITNF